MPFGDGDPRRGTGAADGKIRQPTLTIPCACLCSWSVVTEGPGLSAESELRYSSALCMYLRDHEKHRQAVPERPEAVA